MGVAAHPDPHGRVMPGLDPGIHAKVVLAQRYQPVLRLLVALAAASSAVVTIKI